MDPDREARDQEEREERRKRWDLRIRNEELYEEGRDGLDTTDVTIRLSDGTELRAHREVLEGQSAFFRNALKPGTFKESFTGVISLPNDPPQAVRAMIEFFYMFRYTVPSDRCFTDLDFADEIFHHLDMLDFVDEVFHHLDMLDIARIYMLDELHENVDNRLTYLIRNRWNYMKDNMFLVFELLDVLDNRMKSAGELVWSSVNYMEAFIEDDVWTKLHEQAPDFIAALQSQSEYRWPLLSCRGSGMFLDRLGGEHSVGMVIHHMKCPSCGLVQEAALGLVKPAMIKCRGYYWYGACGGGRAPSDEYFDVTKDNQRKNKKKRKAKKQQKENKVKRKATKKKNSRG
ncbi:BTB/POZ domain containing protein [Lasiodiplodia theobromae]|uniref:BTB/POZ domain containing protein n=1 Tax=Lasiodiplodia theobromae TaxID=45133 RepID=UPI0015C3149C|nr:BTB/POZ domain containing protein [Lasiodiplodia theobromae]KAF4541476.1 BTB/POZ domain containing protein [Lasiodiplodia theobromae]